MSESETIKSRGVATILNSNEFGLDSQDEEGIEWEGDVLSYSKRGWGNEGFIIEK